MKRGLKSRLLILISAGLLSFFICSTAHCSWAQPLSQREQAKREVEQLLTGLGDDLVERGGMTREEYEKTIAIERQAVRLVRRFHLDEDADPKWPSLAAEVYF